MRISTSALLLLSSAVSIDGFVVSSRSCTASCPISSSTELYMGMNRKARRQELKKQNKSRNINTEKVVDDDNSKGETGAVTTSQKPPLFEEPEGARSVLDDRPDVSMIVQDENGMKRIVEGKAVLDVTTGKAVQLSALGPEYRLAEMFPGVPPDVREEMRQDRATADPVEILEALKKAVTLPDGTLPKKDVSNRGLHFTIANWDVLGEGMKKMIGRMKLRNQWQKNIEEAKYYRDLWFHYMVLLNKISAPFRQICFDAEMKIGPNFGNLDVKSYCNGDVYQRAGAFVVLKALCCLWEKKTVDAQEIDKTPRTRTNFVTLLCMGDPKRYLPGNNAIFKLEECAKICYQAQQLYDEFCKTPELFDDLPPELRFIQAAGKISSGTELRRFMIEDFCPKEGKKASCSLRDVMLHKASSPKFSINLTRHRP